MSAPAASPARIVKRVSRWSRPGHGDARPDRCPAGRPTTQLVPKAMLTGAKESPRPTSVRLQLTAMLSRLASPANTAIKSP
jgi:hypothetical protein